MTLATKLTLLRIIAIPFFIVAFFWEPEGATLAGDWGKVAATAIFILASITDYYDGYLARRYQQITTLGRFMDPIADKLLVSTALISMVEYRNLTNTAGYIAIIIIAREFAVTGLRLVCAEKGKVIDASSAGKVKTTFQMIAIITALCLLSTRITFETYGLLEYNKLLMNFYEPLIQILMILAAIATLYSGYDYFKKNWHLLDQ
jgi:CDP-diacylglycerol--glycerol-3-phosphate 3-phosphatidyltransferase